MEFLNFNQLTSLIRQKEINFIGSALTPWHAHGIDCAIRFLQDRGVKINGIILVKPSLKELKVEYILNENHFINDCCTLYYQTVTYHTPLKSIVKSIVKNLINGMRAASWYNQQSRIELEQTIYIASVWRPDVNLFTTLFPLFRHSHNFNIVIADEGLATYFPAVETYKYLWDICSQGGRGRIKILRLFLYRVVEKIAIKRFKSKTSWYNLNLLIGKVGNLYVNEMASRYYHEVLCQYSNLHNINANLPDLNGSVVLCTMAYLQSEIQDNSDIKTLKTIVDELHKMNLKVYLKPHPREVDYKKRYSVLGCEYIDVPCSIETLLVSSPHIKAVISFSSTALVTSKLLFNLKAISIINLVEWDKYGAYIQGEMQSFKDCFSALIEMPDSLKELNRCFP